MPIPPELVGILRRHVNRFGAADDGRLFRSDKGNVVAASTYSRVWKAARGLALKCPARAATSIAGTPEFSRSDTAACRRVVRPPGQRGHHLHRSSVDVLLKVYAKCIDGQEATVNEQIEAALGGPGA
ncbi:integrase [Micromonospora sp. NBC_01740]|uniref:hypothetical protein n=1 Tax=Micromonospora sp. NBC_01740 TaxID=2975986 RepID=UPI002E14ADE3|nr:integrase [Micromonospora sp. NBC_01740]